MKKSEVLILIAKTLHHSFGGMSDTDYEETMGEPRKDFDSLSEHVKDEYYFQAKRVLESIEIVGFLPPRVKLGAMGLEDNGWEAE